jgi:branched-chain amino acid transport system substrate-binding protein
VALAATVGLVAGACSEPESTVAGAAGVAAVADDPASSGAATTVPGDGRTVLSRFVGADWFDGDVPGPKAADPAARPIRVGFLNVDSGPIGAMPELHTSTAGAFEFINAELGGVGGRPVELVPCLLSNPMSADEAQGCARMLVGSGVVAVLGGIGLANGPALSIFADNGIPYVGGIPVNFDEMTSPVSFQFSGGSPAAFTAFAHDAVEREGAERVSILYAEYPSIQTAALDYGADVARALGAEVTEVAFPMVSQDYVAPVQKALESRPDALFVGAADLACAPIMQAVADLAPGTTVYMVGACADAKHVGKVGVERIVGFRFNIENRIDQDVSRLADTEIYTAAMEAYDPDTTPWGAATVSFRAAMNLWSVMDDLGPDVTPAGIIRVLREARDRPSFDGHGFTCDGTVVPALPALCSPQEVIAELSGPAQFREASDGWVDVPAVLARTGVGS